ncbi:MAG: VCBS repeat-containing protein, partial [Planctomycetes bacterium]|nr:VCBS repeat-containing protein [Planctomycetota bacterium]
DFDGDGDLDLVGTFRTVNGLGQLEVFFNDGKGRFLAAPPMLVYAEDPGWVSDIEAVDVDGDGRIDLVVHTRSRRKPAPTRLYLNRGAAGFVDVTATHMPVTTYEAISIAMADVDGDGDIDMVLGTNDQGRLYLNDGRGRFTDQTAGRLPAHTGELIIDLVFCDVDRDGDPDLMLASASFQNRLFLNDGRGTFRDATSTHMPRQTQATLALAVGDVDGDGFPDAVFADAAANGAAPTTLLRNDGTGRFVRVASGIPDRSSFYYGLLLADLDEDGDLDLVVGGVFTERTSLYANLTRHVHSVDPQLGTLHPIELYAKPGHGMVLAIGPQHVRLPLGPLGILEVDPTTMVVFPTVTVPPSGVGSVTVRIPSDPRTKGVQASLQALEVAANGVRLSNHVRIQVQ